MNLQKDLIQHISVLTVAPGYLNFSQPRSSDVLHVGLEDTKLLLRDCLGILAVEDTADGRNIFELARRTSPVLTPYADAFQMACSRFEEQMQVRWECDLDARYSLDDVVDDLDQFLSGQHWYDISQARMLQLPNGTYYQNCSPVCVNCMGSWECASLFFTDETAQWVRDTLKARFGLDTRTVFVEEFDPPKDYLWRARTYAPQSPQSLINYWEAMLPGARRMRIHQLVNQRQTSTINL